jgi:hypothetical protein
VLAAETSKFCLKRGGAAQGRLWSCRYRLGAKLEVFNPHVAVRINTNLFIHILRKVPGSVFQMLYNLRSLYRASYSSF